MPRRLIISNFQESVCRVVCPRNAVGIGTGFFVTTNGLLLTCNHVVSYFEHDQYGNIQLKYFPRIFVETVRGKVPATVIHNKRSTHPLFEEYAVLKADIEDVPALGLGSYEIIEPGDDVLILGFPFGLAHLCATSGMISAKHRSPSPLNNLIFLDMFKIDGSINIGNSGGPLIDVHSSSVVGIVSLRLGSIGKEIEQLKTQKNVPDALIEVLELTNRYLNVGIGEAISIRYASNELISLGIKPT